MFLPDTNTCISFLRRRDQRLISRWQSVRAQDIRLCSIVVYELRFGAERSATPAAEHEKLDVFLQPFLSFPFDEETASVCARIRAELERTGQRIGPHDLQIAASALQ